MTALALPWTLPPRLTAVALAAQWHGDPMRFASALARFVVAAAPLGLAAAVVLRGHGFERQEWRRALERFGDVVRVNGLRLGVSAGDPGDLAGAVAWLADVAAGGADFVQVPENTNGRALWKAARSATGSHVGLGTACHATADLDVALHLFDWVWLSPVFTTPSKPDAPPLGLAAVGAGSAAHPGRVVALGGIAAPEARMCLAAGAAGVASVRAAWADPTGLVAAVQGIAALR